MTIRALSRKPVYLLTLVVLGACVDPDAEALRALQRGAAEGDAVQQYQLAVRYQDGGGLDQNTAQAVAWMQRSATQGFAPAMVQLGAYYTLPGPDQDYAQAVRWLRPVAEQGLAVAQYQLSVLYRLGLGVPQDHAEAYAWINLAMQGGDSDALRDYDRITRGLSPVAFEQGRQRLSDYRRRYRKDAQGR